MSYSTLWAAAHDDDLRRRIAAACAQEAVANATLKTTPFAARALADPWAASLEVIWPVAVDKRDAYEFAANNGTPHPGLDPSVITDADIAAAVQAHWPAA